MTKIAIAHVLSLGAIVTTVPWPLITIPASTSPMIVMKRPIPIPMASLRSCGMALMTASRKPTRTSTVMSEALDDDDAHRVGPAQPVGADEREGHEGVDAEAGGERERVAAVDAHRERGDRGHERGDRQQLVERELHAARARRPSPRICGLTNRM